MDKPKYLAALEAADDGWSATPDRLVLRDCSAISSARRPVSPGRSFRKRACKLPWKVSTARRTSKRLIGSRNSRPSLIWPASLRLTSSVAWKSCAARCYKLWSAWKSEARAFVSSSDESNDHYYRSQIVENARNHIGYHANTAEYRSWVALDMSWTRRSQLVFAIHAIGTPFNGGLICAPFLEFKDTDEDGQTRSAFVPVTGEGFVFFYNEDEDRLLSRFRAVARGGAEDCPERADTKLVEVNG